MQIKEDIIYRIEAVMKCGCKAVGCYIDDSYTVLDVPVRFSACVTHTSHAGVEILEMMLTERVEERAQEKAAQKSAAGTPAPAPLGGGVSEPASARPVLQIAAGTPPVIPLPPRVPRSGGHRPTGGSGGGGGFVRRADPGSGLSPNAAAALAKTSSKAATGLDMELDAVPEDKRVTNLLAQTGFLNGLDDETEDPGYE